MKTKRNIISINEALCNGCGACAMGCHEGAIQMIDGKARIVSELYCDGLGACIGECPVGAITIEEREAEVYDENAVMERISGKGERTILAHLNHLKSHGEKALLQQGLDYIKHHRLNVDISSLDEPQPKASCGCPSSMARTLNKSGAHNYSPCDEQVNSELTHWPIQLHLINPDAEFFKNADMVLAADCTAYSFGNFHSKFMHNHKLAIACPKLDHNKESYVEKITSLIDNAQINTLTVVVMEVPCCNGLLQLAKMASDKASRKVPIKRIVIGVRGDIVVESWI